MTHITKEGKNYEEFKKELAQKIESRRNGYYKLSPEDIHDIVTFTIDVTIQDYQNEVVKSIEEIERYSLGDDSANAGYLQAIKDILQTLKGEGK